VIVTDDRVARFVSDALSVGFVPPYTCMGIEKNGEIIAGVILNVFEGVDVHVSIAGSGWSRSFCRAVGRYVFEQLRCERMTAITENPEIVRFGERLGGQIEGCLRNHFGRGRDGFIVGLLKDEWKY
jgi:RimJ/RimL family protein N-acetyltransferase